MNKSRVHVEFFDYPMKHSLKSHEAGRPIFENVEMIRIRIPGDSKSVHVERAHQSAGTDRETGLPITYAQMYPEHYALFKSQQAGSIIGTPIEHMPGLDAAKVAELKSVSIVTVEQLADLGDREIKAMGLGARALVERAQSWLKQTADHAGTSALAAENAELRERLERLEEMLRPAPELPQAAGDTEEDKIEDGFETMDDDTLKAAIRDFGAAVPSGRASRATLLRVAREAFAQVSAA